MTKFYIPHYQSILFIYIELTDIFNELYQYE